MLTFETRTYFSRPIFCRPTFSSRSTHFYQTLVVATWTAAYNSGSVLTCAAPNYFPRNCGEAGRCKKILKCALFKLWRGLRQIKMECKHENMPHKQRPWSVIWRLSWSSIHHGSSAKYVEIQRLKYKPVETIIRLSKWAVRRCSFLRKQNTMIFPFLLASVERLVSLQFCNSLVKFSIKDNDVIS